MIYEGGSVLFSVVFRLASTNALYDPTDVTLTARCIDDDNVFTPEVTRDSLGTYSATLEVSAPGNWVYRWETGGTTPAVEEGRFVVQKSRVI